MCSPICHDGFTLQDLVSYDRKHNEANGEDSRDGTDDNRSWNCGTEGPSDDPVVNQLRARQVRNFLVTLFCSQGIPMLAAGDEMGRTQQGNNNAYCQDNELSWVDWEGGAKHADLLEFTRGLSELRRLHPVFRRRRFFSGQPAAAPGQGAAPGMLDIAWLTPSGREMMASDWQTGYARSIAVFLNGSAITEPGPHGETVGDDDFLLLVNAHSAPVTFVLPGARFAAAWQLLVDTSAAGQAGPAAGRGQARAPGPARAGTGVAVPGHAMMVLRGIRAAAAAEPRAGHLA